MIPYGKQCISQQDIDSVVSVLKSDWLTQGPVVPKFEAAIAKYCQAQFATAVNSATSALHIACLALGVTNNDIVWTSPISFVASANCALYCGATIDFVDIDLNTGNMSISELEKKLVYAKQNNCLPKVVIPVHLAGQPCNMQRIHQLALQYQFKVIEDASHAIGAQYKNQPIGNCKYSDITVFSFHPVKIITSAEGGMAVTHCPTLDKKMKRLRSHGITTCTDEMTEISHGPWYYQQLDLGFNYRMSELQAALGLSQLSQLDEFVKQRNDRVKVYNRYLNSALASHLTQNQDNYSAYHLYIVQLKPEFIHCHSKVIGQLRDAGIFSHVHYIPIHLQPYYKALGFAKGDFPNAEQYYQSAITLPLHPMLQEQEIHFILATLDKLLS